MPRSATECLPNYLLPRDLLTAAEYIPRQVIATYCHLLPLIATDCHLLPLIASLTAAECVPHQVVREYDEVSRLDAQKTTMLLAVKKKIKEATDDIT